MSPHGMTETKKGGTIKTILQTHQVTITQITRGLFNHTTLEHVFDVQKAFSNICNMSKDIVIIVVPFSQTQHETDSFKDFWRFTPSCLREMFRKNELEVIYEAESKYKNAAIYLLFVGSRHPKRWKGKMPKSEPIREAGDWIGFRWSSKIYQALKQRVLRNVG
jgi:hypothetical protein